MSVCTGAKTKDGEGDKLEVEEKRSAANVFGVHLGSGVEVYIGAARDLPKAGDAGFCGEAPQVLGAIGGRVKGRGSRANEGHVAKDDVKEVGQFIKTGSAEDLSDACNAGIVFDFEVG